jgi:signal transduction histidine kinase/ligand-binding sensor domain-containing protein
LLPARALPASPRGAAPPRSKLLAHLLLGCTALALALFSAPAQPALASPAPDRAGLVDDYQILTWSTAQGLPHSSVYAVAQTPDGYIWCGTEAGLARFDGLHFTVFNAQGTPELGNGQIRALYVDRQGTLWITTRDARLVRLRDGVFSAYPLPRRSSLAQPIMNLASDDDGSLWLMSEDVAVTRFLNGRFDSTMTPWPDGPRQLNIRTGPDGAIWMCRVSLARRQHGQVKVMLNNQTNGNYGFHSPSRTGGFWVSTAQRMGIWGENGWLWQGEHLPWPLLDLVWGEEDAGLRLWLASFGQGVYCVGTNGEAQHFTTTNGLASNYARHLLVDREDNVWVATENGLCRIRPAAFRCFSSAQGLAADRVTGVAPGLQGGLWVGTDGGGLQQFQKGAFLSPTNTVPFPLVTTVLVDSRSNVWAGTRGGGLFRSTPRGFAHAYAPALTSEISALFEDSSGRLWVGQRSLNTVIEVLGDGEFRVLNLPNPAAVADVRCFAEDSAHALWMGTLGTGLFRWNGERFEHFTRTDGLPNDSVLMLYFDRDERALWIGCAGGGLARWQSAHLVTCKTADGLWDDTISQMVDDGHGWFWFGCRKGLFRVSKASLSQFMNGQLTRIHSVSYGDSDGLCAAACSGGFQPAVCRTPDGRFWFPTMQGLTVVNPAAVTANALQPLVHLERVLVNGEEVRPPAKAAADAARPAFRIPPGSHRCEFQYTALSFSAPEAVQFRYRIEGVDPDWIEAGPSRSAVYTRLPPGEHRFLVTAANRDGVWSANPATLRFEVVPAFWQTAWFLASCLAATAVALVGTGWGMARLRARRRMAQMAQIQALEQERARIARDMHDELGARLTGIANLGELATTAAPSPAEMKSQVQVMTGRVRELIGAVNEVVWTVSPDNDSLPNLVSFLSDYTERFVGPTGIGYRLELDEHFPPLPLRAEVRHNLLLAVKEAINNAVRHAAAQRITLSIHVQDRSLVILITDDGRGFDPAMGRPGGQGLTNLAERLDLLQGRTRISSTPGKGTTVTLSLPLPPAPQPP